MGNGSGPLPCRSGPLVTFWVSGFRGAVRRRSYRPRGEWLKIAFCGTPEFAVPSLRAVLRAGHEVQLVVTQPDRAAGRGMALQAPAVKRAAMENGLRVTQPERIKQNEEFRANLESLRPDAIVVVAYGRIVPDWMLALPRFGNINVHGSLLPKYRGAAPVQWAIAQGDRVIGVTTMRLEAGLDTGPMLLAREVPAGRTAMASEMLPVLAEVGAELLVETMHGLETGTVHPVSQDHGRATLAPILTRDEGRIDFLRGAPDIYNRWRGFYPWPGAFTVFRGKKLIVHAMTQAAMEEVNEPLEMTREGELVAAGDKLFVVCGEMSVLELNEVQMEGKKRMSAAEFLRGYQVRGGERLG